MGWTVRDRIPVGTRFSARPDRPWGPPSLLYNGYRVFPGGKVRPGRAADHSPPSSAAIMEEYSYTSTHPLGHTGPLYIYIYIYIYIYTHTHTHKHTYIHTYIHTHIITRCRNLERRLEIILGTRNENSLLRWMVYV